MSFLAFTDPDCLPPADDTYLAQGSPIYGPAGWVQYRSKEGEPYFHNHNTNVTQWERPVDWPQGV
jgi:hypothetical protein